MTAGFASSDEYDRRGNELCESGDFAAAAAVFREGLDAFPGTPELRLDLGHAYLLLEEFALAAREFEMALVLAPGDADAARGRAVALLRLGRATEGLDALDAGLVEKKLKAVAEFSKRAL